jgi:predicted nucleotidyltransferase
MLEDTLKKYFAAQKDVVAVYLYGSHAGGKERLDSDVDLAILLVPYHPKTEHAKRSLYMTELARLTRKIIHPVILNSAGEALLKQILEKGKCMQVNDPKALSRFRMTAIARIADYGYYQQLFQRGVVRQIMGEETHG